MYDTTAFNLTMMYGLPAVTVPQKFQKTYKYGTEYSIS